MEVVPAKAVSPLHLVQVLGSDRYAEFRDIGVVLLSTGEDPCDIWRFAAKHAFWQLSVAKLRQLCKSRPGLSGFNTQQPLAKVLKQLVIDGLPGIDEVPDELDLITGLRAVVPLDPVEEIVGDLDLEEVATADALQEFQASFAHLHMFLFACSVAQLMQV